MDVADVLLGPAQAEQEPGQAVVVLDDQREIRGEVMGLEVLLGELGERLGLVGGHGDERGVVHGVHGLRVVGDHRPAHAHTGRPGRLGWRGVEREGHAPERGDVAVARALEQRPGRVVAHLLAVDLAPELDGPALGPGEQLGPDPAAAVVRIDGDERLADAHPGQSDDLALVLDDDRVFGKVEPGPAPLVLQRAEAVVDLSEIGQVLGDDHGQRRLQILRAGRAHGAAR